MTAFDPALAARIAATGVPLSADMPVDRLSPEREAEIAEHLATTTNWSIGNLAARDLLAELATVRGELHALKVSRAPRLCVCGHSIHAHTVPEPHNCFAYGQTCPCPQYRQLLPDEAVAQLERNCQAADERAREAEEATS